MLERCSYECMLTDQTHDALDTARTAIAIRRELGDFRGEGAALEHLSEVLWCPGRVAEAREAALRAVALLERVPRGRELAKAYARLAQVYMDAEDVDGAVSWGTRALDLAEALNETEIIVHALCSVGTARCLNGQSEGREQIERSLALAQEAGLDEQVARAMIDLAWIAQRHRDYALADDYLEPALEQASKLGHELWRGYYSLTGRRSTSTAVGGRTLSTPPRLFCASRADRGFPGSSRSPWSAACAPGGGIPKSGRYWTRRSLSPSGARSSRRTRRSQPRAQKHPGSKATATVSSELPMRLSGSRGTDARGGLSQNSLRGAGELGSSTNSLTATRRGHTPLRWQAIAVKPPRSGGSWGAPTRQP